MSQLSLIDDGHDGDAIKFWSGSSISLLKVSCPYQGRWRGARSQANVFAVYVTGDILHWALEAVENVGDPREWFVGLRSHHKLRGGADAEAIGGGIVHPRELSFQWPYPQLSAQRIRELVAHTFSKSFYGKADWERYLGVPIVTELSGPSIGSIRSIVRDSGSALFGGEG